MPPSSKTPLQAFGLRAYHVRFLVIVVMLALCVLLYLNEPPRNFPAGTIISVEPGETLGAVASDLKAHHLIRSATLFQDSVILLRYENKIIAGDYYFSQPISTHAAVLKFVHGNFDLAPVRVTIPEGL